jgi:putative transposase
MLKKNEHRPAHLLLDNMPYFITASTHKKRPLLNDNIKYQLPLLMQQEFEKCQWQLNDWVILDNHYHILVYSHKGADLEKIIGRIHFKSGQLIRKTEPNHNHIWWNYWDYCPRNERDYLIRLNYLFNNPIKHGYVKNLHDYPFSSFDQYFEKHGRDFLKNQFKTYTDYKNLNLDEDEF